MATLLKKYCSNALRVLSAQFDASASLTHGTSLGSIREQAIRDFLEGHLPSLVTVVSGQIFDSQDAISSQQDIILVLKSVPRLPFASGIDLVYADGVVATIEVKSSLSGPVLKKIGEGIKSVRTLQPVVWGTSSLGVSHSWPPNRILSVVITYSGTALTALESVLGTMDDITRPDIVLDLSKGLLVRNEGLLLAKQQTGADYINIPDSAHGFMLFLTFLTEITGTLVSRGINWRAYC
jgi:hypothetical protein